MMWFLISCFVIGYVFLAPFRQAEQNIVVEVSSYILYTMVRVVLGSLVLAITHYLILL